MDIQWDILVKKLMEHNNRLLANMSLGKSFHPYHIQISNWK